MGPLTLRVLPFKRKTVRSGVVASPRDPQVAAVHSPRPQASGWRLSSPPDLRLYRKTEDLAGFGRYSGNLTDEEWAIGNHGIANPRLATTG